jgi:hypothetical protein
MDCDLLPFTCGSCAGADHEGTARIVVATPARQELTMNQDLKNFIATVITRAVLPTLLLVAAVAFTTMPYALGHHPGEAGAHEQTLDRHMT